LIASSWISSAQYGQRFMTGAYQSSRRGIQPYQAAEKVHLLCSRSSEILTYDPVRSGFLLPAALQLELFEQPACFTEFFSTLLFRLMSVLTSTLLGL
jgi:hypothetical protein